MNSDVEFEALTAIATGLMKEIMRLRRALEEVVEAAKWSAGCGCGDIASAALNSEQVVTVEL